MDSSQVFYRNIDLNIQDFSKKNETSETTAPNLLSVFSKFVIPSTAPNSSLLNHLIFHLKTVSNCQKTVSLKIKKEFRVIINSGCDAFVYRLLSTDLFKKGIEFLPQTLNCQLLNLNNPMS